MVTFIIPRQDKESDPFDNVIQSKDYQEIISELLYLNNRCRPDIIFATSYLSLFNNRPERRHYGKKNPTLSNRYFKL